MVHAPIPDFFLQSKSKFPALRSLKFGGPQLKIHKWVGLVVQSLKQRGDWATFEELVVPPELALPEASDGIMRGEAISDWIRANINPKWVRGAFTFIEARVDNGLFCCKEIVLRKRNEAIEKRRKRTLAISER